VGSESVTGAVIGTAHPQSSVGAESFALAVSVAIEAGGFAEGGDAGTGTASTAGAGAGGCAVVAIVSLESRVYGLEMLRLWLSEQSVQQVESK
jgi:hypothetical protein